MHLPQIKSCTSLNVFDFNGELTSKSNFNALWCELSDPKICTLNVYDHICHNILTGKNLFATFMQSGVKKLHHNHNHIVYYRLFQWLNKIRSVLSLDLEVMQAPAEKLFNTNLCKYFTYYRSEIVRNIDFYFIAIEAINISVDKFEEDMEAEASAMLDVMYNSNEKNLVDEMFGLDASIKVTQEKIVNKFNETNYEKQMESQMEAKIKEFKEADYENQMENQMESKIKEFKEAKHEANLQKKLRNQIKELNETNYENQMEKQVESQIKEFNETDYEANLQKKLEKDIQSL